MLCNVTPAHPPPPASHVRHVRPLKPTNTAHLLMKDADTSFSLIMLNRNVNSFQWIYAMSYNNVHYIA